MVFMPNNYRAQRLQVSKIQRMELVTCSAVYLYFSYRYNNDLAMTNFFMTVMVTLELKSHSIVTCK